MSGVGKLMKQFQYGSVEPVQNDAPLSMGRNSVFDPARQFFEKSEGTWKALGFLASLSLVCVSIWRTYANFIDYNVYGTLVQCYTLGFAILLGMLEYKDYCLIPKYRVMLEREVHILYTPFGRSGFYVLVGLLVAAEGSFIQLLVGGFSVFIGIYVFFNSKNVDSVLSRLLDSHMSEEKLLQLFSEYDRDNNGSLDPEEIRDLLQHLNQSLTPAELEAAIYKLDKTRDGRISRDELIRWWRNAKKDGDSLDTFLNL